ncbi:3-oxoacyl-[acyl-carrier-protein] reductase FabG [Sphingomonas mucosissima]|uniref:3-oxoacyl-[acyl-carrier-protein] reductase FabG n=2 Tax=Sphingomonas mucosissima TaxID=370959 RepID=A0A245ZSC5_9SPHN|nr:3-oxoacyl-[acyl-carrier-protein] reductase FabG [Sphingomonas mucosissima]
MRSKSAVVAFRRPPSIVRPRQRWRGCAKDLASRNILIKTVQPGPIDTDMATPDSAFAQQMIGAIPLSRYGTVKKIA